MQACLQAAVAIDRGERRTPEPNPVDEQSVRGPSVSPSKVQKAARPVAEASTEHGTRLDGDEQDRTKCQRKLLRRNVVQNLHY